MTNKRSDTVRKPQIRKIRMKLLYQVKKYQKMLVEVKKKQKKHGKVLSTQNKTLNSHRN